MLKVAIVDDDINITVLMKSVIKVYKLNCDVDTCNSSAEFIAKLEKEVYDFVILDLNFYGDVAGFDVALKIKELQPSCKVVILSSLIDIERESKVREIGVYKVLEKPLLPRELQQLILEVNV